MSDESPAPVITVIAALLTAASAATDIMCFTRLGSVFASVMTSNIIFLGLAAARQSATLAEHSVVSFGGYVAGVALATRMAGHPKTAGLAWTRRVAATVLTELAVLAAFTGLWEATGTRPSGGTQLVMIALAAGAMGMQGAIVIAMGIGGVSTTYLTGTLTSLVGSLSGPRSARESREADLRRVLVIVALTASAAVSGWLIAEAPTATPAIPLAALAAVTVTGTAWLRSRPPAAPAPADSPATADSPAVGDGPVGADGPAAEDG